MRRFRGLSRLVCHARLGLLVTSALNHALSAAREDRLRWRAFYLPRGGGGAEFIHLQGRHSKVSDEARTGWDGRWDKA